VEQEVSTREKKSQSMLAFLLSANKKPIRAVQPGMRAFHNPAPRAIVRDEERSLLFVPRLHL
jgi:hypothetical protein